jgi:hypothetical protein
VANLSYPASVSGTVDCDVTVWPCFARRQYMFYKTCRLRGMLIYWIFELEGPVRHEVLEEAVRATVQRQVSLIT